MTDDKPIETKAMFISYTDENNQSFDGYVNVIEIKEGWVVIDAGKNILHIPSSRIKKLKERKEEQ